jgi:hypothetical protein
MNIASQIVPMEKESNNIFGNYQDFAMTKIKIQLVYPSIKKCHVEVVAEVYI